MATECHSEESSWLAMQGAVRNFVYITGAAIISGWAASWFLESARMVDIRNVMRDIWAVQGILVGAVLALIYRLSTDTASVKGMNSSQRRKLDEMVTRKSRRLWLLVACIVLPVFLARIDDKFEVEAISAAVLWSAIALALFSSFLTFYLPSMWTELRRFVTSLVVQAEQDERIKADLERLRGKDGDGVQVP